MIPRPFRWRLSSTFVSAPPLRPTATGSRPASSFSVPYHASFQPCKPLSSSGRGRSRSIKGFKWSSTSSSSPAGRGRSGATAGTFARDDSAAESSHRGGPSFASTRAMHTSSQSVCPPRPRTQGRRRRRNAVAATAESSTDRLERSRDVATPSTRADSADDTLGNGRKEQPPVLPSPLQSAAYVAYTPSHLPLPIPLGNNIYTLSNLLKTQSSSDLFNTGGDSTTIHGDQTSFDAPIGNAPIRLTAPIISDPNSTTLSDHLRVLDSMVSSQSTMAFPDLGLTAEDDLIVDLEEGRTADFEDFSRVMSEKKWKNRLDSEQELNEILERLGANSRSTNPEPSSLSSVNAQPSGSASPSDKVRTVDMGSEEALDSDADIQAAVSGLMNTLQRLDLGRKRQAKMMTIIGPDGEEGHFDMTSVIKKRRKKIRKHKYKKRRKEQRALRKRLGK